MNILLWFLIIWLTAGLWAAVGNWNSPMYDQIIKENITDTIDSEAAKTAANIIKTLVSLTAICGGFFSAALRLIINE